MCGWCGEERVEDHRLLCLVLASCDDIKATRMCVASEVKSKQMTTNCDVELMLKTLPMCRILPKNCHMAPSPLDTQVVPCDTWHRSFHSGISHPEFFSTDIPSGRKFSLIPPGCLTSAIISGRRSTFSGYFTSGAYRRMREEDDLTSPDKHVRILW